jgi:hypothetical protein
MTTILSSTLAQDASSSGAPSQVTPPIGLLTAVSAPDNDSVLFATYTLVILASLVCTITTYRIVLSHVRYIRTLACLNNNTQNYFITPNKWYGFAKTHLLYAPLFQRRHMRELHIFRSWPIGVLPTRLQSLFLTGLIGMNIALCMIGIAWNTTGSNKMVNMANHLRMRTGTLSIVNLIPLVIMGGRNNPLINMLNIPYDTFNLMHRWFGRIFVAEAVAHTVGWTVEMVQSSGWDAVWEALESTQLVITGTVAMVAVLVIILQASALIRHAFYETFLHLHIALILLTFIFLYLHLDSLQPLIYLQTSIAAWAIEVCTLFLLGSFISPLSFALFIVEQYLTYLNSDSSVSTLSYTETPASANLTPSPSSRLFPVTPSASPSNWLVPGYLNPVNTCSSLSLLSVSGHPIPSA